MRLTHPKVMSGSETRAGFTLIEVLLALSLTLGMVGLTVGAVVTFSRANTVTLAHEELNRTALTLQDVVRQDLGRIARTATFNNNGTYQSASSTSTRLRLRNPTSGGLYSVTYVWAPSTGVLERRQTSGPNPGLRRFYNVGSFSFSNLTDGQVVVVGDVREDPTRSAGQRAPFRVAGQVRMR